MFGTVEHFTDYLKAQIMRNFCVEEMISLDDCRASLIEEIQVHGKNVEDRKEYEANLERAFSQVNLEIFGYQEIK
ncbi:hypothetical protein ACQKL0_12685 [Peribacillus sp. NPDC097264]|uniref:hypothetical protein n=1 Tax=unclassified Peribacillus TaxID=2675266 RepID=UPI0038168240